MKSKLSLFLAATIASVGAIQAAPVTYDFTATNFVAVNHSPIPVSSIAGSFTLDGSTVTQIDLTIGSHTYSVAEVKFNGADIEASPISIFSGDDFSIWPGPILYGPNSSPFSLIYTVAGTLDMFLSQAGTINVASNAVPLPTAVWLFSSSLLGLFGLARKRV